jgi:hypothetical protein
MLKPASNLLLNSSLTRELMKTKETHSKVSRLVVVMVVLDLVLDDDVTLLGLFSRYAEEPEELKKQVITYASN